MTKSLYSKENEINRNESSSGYKKRTGNEGEQRAATFLEQNGFQILERNFRSRQGEIDIIAKESCYLCFIEVKNRSSLTSGYPQEAVGKTKIQRICKTALYYIYIKKLPSDTPVRFDIVVILGNRTEIIRNAFLFQY